MVSGFSTALRITMLRFLFGRPRTVRVPIDRSNIEVQQVKVTRHSRPLVTRFFLTCAVTTIIIQGMKYWDPLGTYAKRDVLQEEFERVKKDAAGHIHPDQHKPHQDINRIRNRIPALDTTKSDTIRLTVPIWLRKGHQRLYSRNDPEWKEFTKLQNDAKRVNQLRQMVGESVMIQIREQGRNEFELSLIQFNGKVGIAIELVPQIYTPPIYEVPCVWLSMSAISAGWRPLSSQTGTRMERVFRPVVLFDASTEAMRTFFHVTYYLTKAKISTALGRDTSGLVVAMPSKVSPKDNTTTVATQENQKSKKPILSHFPNLQNGDEMRKIHGDVVSAMPYSMSIRSAAATFNHVKTVRQKLAMSTNVRGICQLRGFVTFFGDRGRFRVEILAHYLPAEEVFIGALNVQQQYVVPDYRAWETLLDKQEKEQRDMTNNASTPSHNVKPIDSAPPTSHGKGKEEDND